MPHSGNSWQQLVVSPRGSVSSSAVRGGPQFLGSTVIVRTPQLLHIVFRKWSLIGRGEARGEKNKTTVVTANVTVPAEASLRTLEIRALH
jgi:hypothetical protein